MRDKIQFPFWVVLPGLVHDGMCIDGVLYAAVAKVDRNLNKLPPQSYVKIPFNTIEYDLYEKKIQ